MAGIITGFYGFQRSGKTALSVFLSRSLSEKNNIPVYTNMQVEGFNLINSLDQVPYNFEPKILLLDEAMSFLDSRIWADNTKSSFFFNVIGKLNILLILTSPRFDMIEKRLRDQHNYIFICKSDEQFIYCKVLDVQRNKSRVFNVKKSKEFFKYLNYNTLDVPDIIDMKIDKFINQFKKNNEKIKIKSVKENIKL